MLKSWKVNKTTEEIVFGVLYYWPAQWRYKNKAFFWGEKSNKYEIAEIFGLLALFLFVVVHQFYAFNRILLTVY